MCVLASFQRHKQIEKSKYFANKKSFSRKSSSSKHLISFTVHISCEYLKLPRNFFLHRFLQAEMQIVI